MKDETKLHLLSTFEEKKKFEEAALLGDMLLSEFLRRAAHLYAQEIMRAHQQTITLSKKDGIKFLEALKNPPKPNKYLKAVMRKHRKNVKK